MTIMFRLEPLIAPQEKLLEALRQRPPISVGPEDTQVVIGRGGLTGIADHSIGKNVFSLEMDDKCRETHSIKATLLKDSDRCRVHVNGRRWEVVGATRYLRNGDFLSLNDLKYEYKLFSMNSSSQATVELLSSPSPGQASLSTILDEKVPTSLGAAPCSPPSEHPPKKALAPAPSSSSPAITLSADIATRFSDDIQCSICLEIQIYSQTLVPCGHSFCSPCINDLEDCPQCRAKITQLVPSRQLDGLIANMVAVPGLLDAEDVQQYQERKKQHHPTPSKVPKRAAKRQRRTPTQHSPLLHLAHHHHHHLAPALSPFASSTDQAAYAGYPTFGEQQRRHATFFASAPAAPTPSSSRRGAHVPSSSSSAHTQLLQRRTDTTATATTTGGASVLDAIHID